MRLRQNRAGGAKDGAPAIVNYNHTCYPAHQVKVNGRVVYLYTPGSNEPTFIFECLALELFKVVGEQTSTTPVPPLPPF